MEKVLYKKKNNIKITKNGAKLCPASYHAAPVETLLLITIIIIIVVFNFFFFRGTGRFVMNVRLSECAYSSYRAPMSTFMQPLPRSQSSSAIVDRC